MTPNPPTDDTTWDAIANEESFADLVAGLRSGSEEAAWRLVDQYTPYVLRIVRAQLPRVLRSKVDSTDLANTMFGSLLVNRHRWSGVNESAQFLALLAKATHDRVVDEYRKYLVYAARNISSEDGVYNERTMVKSGGGVAGDGKLGGREQTPSQTAIAREKWERIVSTLDPQHRDVVSLKIQGKTYRQIAEQLPGVSERTARRVISRVFEQLSG